MELFTNKQYESVLHPGQMITGVQVISEYFKLSDEVFKLWAKCNW